MDTTTPLDQHRGLTRAEVIDRVHQVRDTAHHAAVEEIQLAAQWALLHPHTDQASWPAHWGDPTLEEEVTPLAGPGAPLVAEFAPAELAAALGTTLDTARQHIADALELTYRLPRLWDLTQAGEVPVWQARLISRETHDLPWDAVTFADKLISAVPDKIRLVDAARLVHEARLFYDPDRATAEEQADLDRRGVWLRHRGNPATTDVSMTLDTPDAAAFNQAVTILAAELEAFGDTAPLDVRRAKAVGILADPQVAIDLLGNHDHTASNTGTGTGTDAGTSTGYRSPFGAVNVYAHFDATDLEPESTGSTAAVCLEKLGAATTQLLTDWLARHTAAGGHITIRPVINLNDDWSVDAHDPPEAMREHVLLRDAHCVFPGCRRESRGCDLDHITAYIPMTEGGPPGQTHPGNLAPLCRTHHRIKTFTTWAYKRRDDGTYTWTSPTGHQYDVRPVSRRPPDRQTR